MALLAGMLPACEKAAEGTSGPLSGKITVDGSDSVYPISKAMAEAFGAANSAVQFSIDFSGTGGGFEKFCAGKVDIEGASRPIKAKESEQCKKQRIEYIEVPIAFDSLPIVVNAKNDFVDCLTVKELKAIWEPAAEGKTKQWNQIRPSFPARPLTLFGPGKASGTFDYFTFAILGTEGVSRNDYTASEDYTVLARGVAADPNALGYFAYAYYQANKAELKVIGVDNGHGCVLPDAQTVAYGTYQPLSRPLFLYVSATAATRREVRAFVQFYLRVDHKQYVTQVGYVPLPSPALIAGTVRFDKGTTGSALGGHGSVINLGLDSFDDDERARDRIRNAVVQ